MTLQHVIRLVSIIPQNILHEESIRPYQKKKKNDASVENKLMLIIKILFKTKTSVRFKYHRIKI